MTSSAREGERTTTTTAAAGPAEEMEAVLAATAASAPRRTERSPGRPAPAPILTRKAGEPPALAAVIELFTRPVEPAAPLAPAVPEPDADDVLLAPPAVGTSWRLAPGRDRARGAHALEPGLDAPAAPAPLSGRPDRAALGALGVTFTRSGGRVRVFSGSASAVQLCVWDRADPGWLVKRLDLVRDEHGVWSGDTRALRRGVPYTLRVDGPAAAGHAFDLGAELLDPYGAGLLELPDGSRRSVALATAFDWRGTVKPRTPLADSIVYEVHVKGFSAGNPALPAELRGTYAGLGHWSSVEYLRELGITAVELLPVQAHTSEERLRDLGAVNYWGYNTLGYFAPHPGYATRASRAAGPASVIREFQEMVRALHAGGIEVILDVVYNHTAEEGPAGPTTSLRGLDPDYYRRTERGHYVDVTGCGNTLDASHPAVQHLVIESLAHWAGELGVDGFRFDLAATLGRDERAHFDPAHPLLAAVRDDPRLAEVKLIAEPWDVGLGGWQVGNFPTGFAEWNDGYRDAVRDFWLADRAVARRTGSAPAGIGALAGRLTGSAHVFGDRGPLAGVNFVTAHDGFTLHDLTAYDVKHNLDNGEGNRDGTDANRSYNHGVEGATSDEQVLARRRATMRNLLGTLLLSAGVPMLTAGDEFGRSQAGNNNAYCHDDELTWLSWDWDDAARDLWSVTQHLIRLRRENPALRPARFGRTGEDVPGAARMAWFNRDGAPMGIEDWDSPEERTLQYLASTDGDGDVNRILLIVHGRGNDVTVTLPALDGIGAYTLLWDSSDDLLRDAHHEHAPGDALAVSGYSMRLLRAEADATGSKRRLSTRGPR